MCKFLKPCLYIAGGIVGIITSIKLIIWWDRSGDSPPVSPTYDKVKDELSNNDNTKAFPCQIIYKKPYSLKNEYDDQDEEGTKEIIQKSL